jgi:type II restriction/modification system DNA methylase subunit YeeA
MLEKWWLHGEARPGLRRAISNLSRCIVTPEVAKHRLFVWMDTTTIPDHKLHVIARDDDYFFGVLQSSAHEIWTIATCSWMGVGNDPSYNSSTTFGTFPFPWPPGHEPETKDVRIAAIADAARNLVDLRSKWLNPAGISGPDLRAYTLTNLYNQRPEWLSNAHETLDRAVYSAYGLAYSLTRSEILRHLLALNRARGTNSLDIINSGLPPKKAPGVERPTTQRPAVKSR